MSTYYAEGTPTDSLKNFNLEQQEVYLYGSSRLGMRTIANNADHSNTGPPSMQYYSGGTFTRGWKQYELTNHLGNVLVTVSDRKIGVSSGGSLYSYYNPDIVSGNDYYPFGMMARVSLATTGKYYKFGFNGKEFDWEAKGWQNQIDYGMRIYDPRIGRFLSEDPLTDEYPWFSPYQYAGNSPILNIDVDGLENQPTQPNTQGNQNESDRQASINSVMYPGTHRVEHEIAKALGYEKAKPIELVSMIANSALNNIADNKRLQNIISDKYRNGELDFEDYVAMHADYQQKIDVSAKTAGWAINTLYTYRNDQEGIDAYNRIITTRNALIVSTSFDLLMLAIPVEKFVLYGGSLIYRGTASLGGRFVSKELGAIARDKLFSFNGGYGLFGKSGLRIGGFKMEALYKNPRSGFGHGTFFSIKSVKPGGSFVRWDYGILHKGGVGVHSTFRLNVAGNIYGSTGQRPWYSPFTFWRYQQK